MHPVNLAQDAQLPVIEGVKGVAFFEKERKPPNAALARPGRAALNAIEHIGEKLACISRQDAEVMLLNTIRPGSVVGHSIDSMENLLSCNVRQVVGLTMRERVSKPMQKGSAKDLGSSGSDVSNVHLFPSIDGSLVDNRGVGGDGLGAIRGGDSGSEKWGGTRTFHLGTSGTHVRPLDCLCSLCSDSLSLPFE